MQLDPFYTRPRGKNFFSYSTQLSTKFILLINVEMPTIVRILTFISMINTTSDLNKETSLFVNILVLWAVETSCSVELSTNKFYNLGGQGSLCTELRHSIDRLV